eukprot:823420-Prymnesium_polylepis.1
MQWKQRAAGNASQLVDGYVGNWQVPEELRAHAEITAEFQLSWRHLPTLGSYLGPMDGLTWINQLPVKEKGKWLPPQYYPPVYQLVSCGRCT